MSEASEAFDRAAEREARQREADQPEDVRAARGNSLSGLMFFGVALVAHWLVVQRVTGWLVAHIILVGMCAAFVVQVWLGLPKDETEGAQP